MATFLRTLPTPTIAGDYSGFRRFVREDFRRCCAYCLLHEFWAGGENNFELDHFRPLSRFPDLANDFYNLYYSCHICNHWKSAHWPSLTLQGQGVQFVDLCRDDVEQHYHLQNDGRLEPLTLSAQYTLLTLRLNSEHLVDLRAFAMRSDFHTDMRPF